MGGDSVQPRATSKLEKGGVEPGGEEQMIQKVEAMLPS